MEVSQSNLKSIAKQYFENGWTHAKEYYTKETIHSLTKEEREQASEFFEEEWSLEE